MKAKRNWLAITVVLITLFGIGYAFSGPPAAGQNAEDGLALELQSDETSYLPGEMVSLHFSIINKSNVPMSLSKESTVWDGNLKVLIAYEGGPLREYFGPGWGARDRVGGEPLKLAPAQSFETDATILWNQRMDTSHLSQPYAKRLTKERITTDYALSNAGTYSIRAVLHNPQTGNIVESTPLIITVEEPQDGDLEIWNKIKEDANYGFFIQTGGLIEHPKGPKTTKVANDLETLLSQHSDSHYAKSIRSSLNKRRETIERLEREEPLEN